MILNNKKLHDTVQ